MPCTINNCDGELLGRSGPNPPPESKNPGRSGSVVFHTLAAVVLEIFSMCTCPRLNSHSRYLSSAEINLPPFPTEYCCVSMIYNYFASSQKS